MAWRREGLPSRIARERDYEYKTLNGHEVILSQNYEGIGTTVWDGSIVLARYLEHSIGNGTLSVAGKSIIELGAGCGLVGMVAAHYGCARVLLTEMQIGGCLRNLHAIVERNFGNNGVASVAEHTWGERVDSLNGPFDIVIGAEVMYVEQATPGLISSIRRLSHPKSRIFMSYGRNRQAEDIFFKLAQEHFVIREIPTEELHPQYHHEIIKVLELTPRA